jgi:hypothetical protein
MTNLKRKSNIQTTKLIKYIARVYQGLKILEHENLIIETTSSERFADFVLWVVQREKEGQKVQNVQSKLFKQVKNKIWEHYLISFNHRKVFVGVVFALAGQEMLTEV